MASEVIIDILDQVAHNVSEHALEEDKDEVIDDETAQKSDHDDSIISINDSIITNIFGEPVHDSLPPPQPHLN